MSEYTIGTSLNEVLGGQLSHVSTGEPVVSNRILEVCGLEASSGSAAPQVSNSGIADLISKPKPLGLG